MNQNYDELLWVLGLKFNNPKLLHQAFVHRSYLNEAKPLSFGNESKVLNSNERFEFLGDSILSFVMSAYLFNLRPSDTEGDLTNLRSFIVKTKSLAEAAQKLSLGEYLFLSRGEDASGGRQNIQLLANTYESLIGAIYLDQGLEAVKKVIGITLLPLFQNELQMGPPKDAKSELQEVAQNKTKQSPLYKIVDTKGPDHAKEFVVAVFIQGKELGRGVGNSKQEAEEHAATQALQKI